MPAITRTDLHEALPDVRTSLSFKALRAPVTLYRDAWGIPHIKAENENDLFFAQGFATAQDRLFHMDYDRMRCLGRWAEYAGPRALPQDRLIRRRQLARASKADMALCSPDARTMLEAYAAGVNALMDTTTAWPVEYKLLGVRPERWEPWHCILVYKVRNTAEGSFHAKLWLARLAAEIGPERAAAITHGYLPGHLLTLPPGAEYRGPVENAAGELAEAAKHMSHFSPASGESNGWAVSGERTVSGKPLVAGDSHRNLDTPNVYYQTHLSCPTFSAIGHAVPGYPGVLHFCHNEHVAWGMTHGMGDVQDLFVEQFRDGPSGRQYLFRGEWRAAAVSHETLKARGGSEERIEVTETHHGPVIAGEPARGWGITLADPGSSMATKWVDSAYQVMKSKSAAELDLAFDEWTDRTNNYPHADTQGNFGYVLKGRFPVRHRANGWGPVPGWTGDHDWQGMVPPDKLPKTQNPREGWVVTCNQRTVDEKYPYYISNAWAPEYRARRIVERIAVVRAGGQKMDVGRMAAIHGERVSMPGRVFARAAKGLKVNGALAARARDLLATWDGSMDRESAGAAVYSAVAAETLAALARHHYGRFAEEALTVEGGGGSVHINRYLKPLMADGLARDDRSLLPPGQTWQTLLAASVERAAARLEKELGADVAKWSWGRLHHTAHRHPLSASFPDAAPLLDPPQVATHGDGETPCNGSHGALTFTHAAGPVNRYVHDPSDWRNSKWVVPLGASGHAGSKHYADQQKLWADVEYVPMLWDFEQIAREAESAQRLVPG